MAEETEEVTYADVVYDTTPITDEDGAPLALHWNPYLLSPLLTEDDSIREGADAMIKAILNHRQKVVFSSPDVMNAVCDNLFYEFPPSALCEFEKNTETCTVKIRYRLPRNEHLEAIASFGARVEEIVLSTLQFGDGDAEKALLLYHEVCRSVSYFYEDYKSWQTNAFYALTEGKTICYGFADAYNYLLRQVGVEAYLVKSRRPSDNAPHGWSIVKIDDLWYHADPTWESNAFSGESFLYFGYTDVKRKNAVSLDIATIGEGLLKQPLLYHAISTRFEKLNSMDLAFEEWTLDREKQVILFDNKEYPYS